jgi:hypothetical protein
MTAKCRMADRIREAERTVIEVLPRGRWQLAQYSA